MRLTSWLDSLRNGFFGHRVPQARRVPRKMARMTEVLEQRTLLSAEYSLELVHRDSLEGAVFGSGNVAQLIIHKTPTDGGWGASMGVVLTFAETGTAMATPDENWLFNDYYLMYDEYGTQMSPSRNPSYGLGLWFTVNETAHLSIVARQDNVVEGTENIHVQLMTDAQAGGIAPEHDMYHDTLSQ